MTEDSKRKKSGLFKSIIFAVIPCIVFLIILEIGLRKSGISFDDDGFAWGKTADPVLGWALRPNYQGVYFDWATGKPGEKSPQYRRTIKINNAGFRDDEEITLEKLTNTIRIITLGDSCTYGWGVESSNTFSKLLEKKLNAASPGVNFQVINAGIPGYTSYQGILLLKHKLLRYSPDIIISAYGWNSHFIFPYTDREWIKPVSPMHAEVINIARKIFIYRAVTDVIGRLNKKSKSELKYRVPPEDLRDTLRQLNDTAVVNNVKVVFTTIPSNVLTGQVAEWTLLKHSLDDNKVNMVLRHKMVNEIISEVAGEKGALLVDVAEKFNQLKLTEGRQLFYRPEDEMDDVHPNEEGHQVIAEELFKTLSANNFTFFNK